MIRFYSKTAQTRVAPSRPRPPLCAAEEPTGYWLQAVHCPCLSVPSVRYRLLATGCLSAPPPYAFCETVKL